MRKELNKTVRYKLSLNIDYKERNIQEFSFFLTLKSEQFQTKNIWVYIGGQEGIFREEKELTTELKWNTSLLWEKW